MGNSTKDPFSAGAQGLGYTYQARLALFKLLQFPEEAAVLMEKDDDVDFIDNDGTKTLASLKHRAEGDRLTNLSTDFWKSVNIWLTRYNRDGKIACSLRFFLFTTSTVSETSFLSNFLPTGNNDTSGTLQLIQESLSATTSQTILPITLVQNRFFFGQHFQDLEL